MGKIGRRLGKYVVVRESGSLVVDWQGVSFLVKRFLRRGAYASDPIGWLMEAIV